MTSTMRWCSLAATAAVALLAPAIPAVQAQIGPCTYGSYNFTPLIAHDFLYQTVDTDFILAVCGNLLEWECANPSASACVRTARGDINAGEFSMPAYVKWQPIDGSQLRRGVTYSMKGGAICRVPGAPYDQNIQSNINFACAPEGTPLSLFAEEVSGGSGCVYNYTIQTPLGCITPPAPLLTCGGMIDGQVFDFTKLVYSDLTYKTDSQLFAFRMCGSVTTPECMAAGLSPTMSSCTVVSNQTYDMGEFVEGVENPALTYLNPNNHALGVSFTIRGAQTCPSAADPGTMLEWRTNVNIMCARDLGPMRVVPSGQECAYNFTIPTPLGCMPASSSFEELIALF